MKSAQSSDINMLDFGGCVPEPSVADTSSSLHLVQEPPISHFIPDSTNPLHFIQEQSNPVFYDPDIISAHEPFSLVETDVFELKSPDVEREKLTDVQHNTSFFCDRTTPLSVHCYDNHEVTMSGRSSIDTWYDAPLSNQSNFDYIGQELPGEHSDVGQLLNERANVGHISSPVPTLVGHAISQLSNIGHDHTSDLYNFHQAQVPDIRHTVSLRDICQSETNIGHTTVSSHLVTTGDVLHTPTSDIIRHIGHALTTSSDIGQTPHPTVTPRNVGQRNIGHPSNASTEIDEIATREPIASLEMESLENLRTFTNDVMSDLDLDESLVKATMEAASSGTITPLLKEELKSSIQSKLLAMGQPEMVVPRFTPTPERLSEDDVRKREERRQRNKMAAQRCRSRKRQRADSLSEEASDLEKENTMLEGNIKMLRGEVAHLTAMLSSHVCTGRRRRRLANESATSSTADG